jgi:hypothetical protein
VRRAGRIAWAEVRCWWHTLWWLWKGHCRFAGYDAQGRLVYLGCVMNAKAPQICRVFYRESQQTCKEEAMAWEVIEYVGGHVWALAGLDARGRPRAEGELLWKGAVEPDGHALRLAKKAHPNLDLIARHLIRHGSTDHDEANR